MGLCLEHTQMPHNLNLSTKYLLWPLIKHAEFTDKPHESSIFHLLGQFILQDVCPLLDAIQLCVEPRPNHRHDVIHTANTGLVT